jgi:superfamily II DNA or RNA helicase
MEQSIISKLLNYQIPHCLSLIYSFENSSKIIDASDTGTGKTYCSLAVCKQFKLKPIIICPKSVIQNWKDVCAFFEIEPENIINYERVINCSFSRDNQDAYPFILFNKESKSYEWLLYPNHIVILDEVHRCKNSKTLHSKLLLSLKNVNNKVIMLSATLADKIKLFKNFGYIMGFYDNPNSFSPWIKKLAKSYNNDIAIALNKKLFPFYGGRMRIKDLGDMFPKNDVRAKCYQMTNADKIAEQYKIIEDAYQNIKEKAESAQYILPKIIRARQAIELLKIPTFLQLINENLVDGKSSVVFVNFNQTMKTIADELKIDCLVHGEQTIEERNQNIKDFQSNKKSIIILNMRAGSVGISLHDLMGSHQRVSIISPTWSAQDFIQAIGRIHRAGAKTDAIQKVVFCDGTIEEFICETLKYKLVNLSKLNDGDFDTYKVIGITDKKDDGSESDSDNTTEENDPNEYEKLLGDNNVKSVDTDKTKQLFNPVSSSTNKKSKNKEFDI